MANAKQAKRNKSLLSSNEMRTLGSMGSCTTNLTDHIEKEKFPFPVIKGCKLRFPLAKMSDASSAHGVVVFWHSLYEGVCAKKRGRVSAYTCGDFSVSTDTYRIVLHSLQFISSSVATMLGLEIQEVPGEKLFHVPIVQLERRREGSRVVGLFPDNDSGC